MSDKNLREELLATSIRAGGPLKVETDDPETKQRKKEKFEKTHKRKTFWLRNDITKLVDQDIKSDRGAMTRTINNLLHEYYRKQNRINK